MRFSYCPNCGAKLIEKKAGDDGAVPFCEACDKYWFDSFASCSIIMVVNDENEIALLKQSYLSDQYWTFVAGFIKPGENAEETAIREVKEELGLDVVRLEYAGTYWFDLRDQFMHGFIGYTKKAGFQLSSEVNEAIWVPAENAPEKMFPKRPGNTQYPIYEQYMRGQRD